jgi:SlyX protein
MSLDSRVTELEVKLSFAEDLIDSLNKTVFRQQEQIGLLQEQLSVLRRQIREDAANEQRDLREEIPPHY